ncbi:hypothetical protein ARAM_003767 [Aspergillus rambellii]|uniref:Uncharacterized protein n=1 Tax=Aspergillus rambellii TaxID=308745 RepID=A0A0F8XMG1_9EURO|nr:hypothetical protein ARAM_003767 [Aspergillus rambellii]
MGPQPMMPKATGTQGYPTTGKSASYSGLCSFACNYRNCIEGVCGTAEVPLTVPTMSPFTLETCTAGSGPGALASLCSYSCNVGYCPIHNRTCTATGPLNVPAAANTSINGLSTIGANSGLCHFACEWGYCPGPTYVDNANITARCADDDGSDPACAESEVCDFTRIFPALDVLAAATLINYTEITSSYDTKFDDYVQHVKEIIPEQLTKFISSDAPYGPGNQFFQCTYSYNSGDSSTGSCPGDIGIDSGTFTVYYDLVDAEWVLQQPIRGIGCMALHRVYAGFPVKAPDSVIMVANPKEIITQALPNLQNLTATISTAKIDLALGSWLGTTDDVVQSLSMAVFLLSQAVANMQAVVAITNSYEAAKKKQMINKILIGVLLLVPFLGELDAVADTLVGLARIIRMIGDAGVGATTIYNIVQDPKMVPLTIMETLLASGMRDQDSFSTMGAARRAMSKNDMAELGSEIKALDDQFQGIVSKCLPK